MEVEVSELIGAERGERRPEDRATHRNGYRPRRGDTRASSAILGLSRSVLDTRRGRMHPLVASLLWIRGCPVDQTLEFRSSRMG